MEKKAHDSQQIKKKVVYSHTYMYIYLASMSGSSLITKCNDFNNDVHVHQHLGIMHAMYSRKFGSASKLLVHVQNSTITSLSLPIPRYM